MTGTKPVQVQDPHVPEDELRALATRAIGRSLAELDALIRDLRSRCRHEERGFTRTELAEALDQDRDPEHDRRIAVHECGHAIVATALRQSRVNRMALTTEGGETARTRLPAAGTEE